MSERTIEDALAHAEISRGGYVDLHFPEDLALLADEVKRLREEMRNCGRAVSGKGSKRYG